MKQPITRKWIFRLAFGGALGLVLVAFGLERFLGRDVLLIAPHDEPTVRLNRALYVPGDPVADLYGNSMSKPVRVIILSDRRVIRPSEDPSQLLLEVDSARSEHALQAQTVWFVTRYALAVLLAVALVTVLWPRRNGFRELSLRI